MYNFYLLTQMITAQDITVIRFKRSVKFIPQLTQPWMSLLSHGRCMSYRCGQISVLSHSLAFTIFQFLSQASFKPSLYSTTACQALHRNVLRGPLLYSCSQAQGYLIPCINEKFWIFYFQWYLSNFYIYGSIVLKIGQCT